MDLDEKHRYRAPKQARSRQRFEEILRCAERYIEEGRLESFTLLDLVQDANTTVGSVYHFFPSKEAVLVALIHRAHDAFEAAARDAAQPPAADWRTQIRASVASAYAVYENSAAARELILGPGYIWPVRLADSARNQSAARAVLELLVEEYSVAPAEDASERVAQAITIMDALFRKSFEESGTISEDCLSTAQEEFVEFLERRLQS